jgi:hypothetical protein
MRGHILGLVMACACVFACGGERDTAPGVATVAAAVTPARVEAGAPLRVSYTFTPAAGATLPADQWVFVHALDDSNELLWTDDHAPAIPTQSWKAGQPVTYERTTFVPRGTATGEIRFEVGLFSRSGGDRLPLVGTDRGMRSYEVASTTVVAPTNPVMAGEGWYDPEAGEGPGRQWHWSRKENRLSFRNPRAPATVYLEIDQPVTTLPSSQAVEVRSAGGGSWTYSLAPGSTQLISIPLSVEQLGTAESVDLTVGVGPTFVPAATPQLKSSDTRELGIRLLNAFVGPGEKEPR